MTHLDLNSVDVDGALREAAEDAGFDRSDFIKKGALAGGGVLVGGLALNQFVGNAEAAISTKKKSLSNDLKIGNYALTLEYLEAAFYKEAVANLAGSQFGSNPAMTLFAQTVAQHEATHVKALKKLLGGKAVKSPKFDFGAAVTDVPTFAKTSQVLEDTGVSAYAGQGPNIKTRGIVVAALEIHSVEARHAAWIRFLNSGGAGAAAGLPAPKSFDLPATEKKVLSAVKGTGFIKG